MAMRAPSTGRILSANTLISNDVVNAQNEKLGTIEELMIDLDKGCIAYAVMSFGGFLGMGDKLFAIPWNALSVDTDDKRLVLNVKKKLMEEAPGFDKEHWPNMADQKWGTGIHSYYGAKPFWQ